MDNVYLSSYGYSEKYGGRYSFSKKLEEELKPYIENNKLKTDIVSLSKVAEILDNWNDYQVVINFDGTITFYDPCY